MDEKIVKDSQGLAKDLANDCIRRQAAIDAMEQAKEQYFDRRVIIGKMQNVVSNLPSAQPERNTGEWREHIFDGIMGRRPRALMCTNCNVISIYASNFCPNCGAKMGGSE